MGIEYVLGALCAVIVILLLVCRTLWQRLHESNRVSIHRQELEELHGKVKRLDSEYFELDDAVSYLGILFDHAGVHLERTIHQSQSKDLKLLGSMLRNRRQYCENSLFDLATKEAQQKIGDMADRYGVEPIGGTAYQLKDLIRVASWIFDSVADPAIAPSLIVIIERHYGGIYKRIDENRELLELLQEQAPDLLQNAPWVEGWLDTQDRFLIELAEATKPDDSRLSSHFPRPWPSDQKEAHAISAQADAVGSRP